MRYTRFHLLTLPAKTACALWQTGLGLLLAFVIMYALTQGVFAVTGAIMAPQGFEDLLGQINRGDTALGLILMLGLMGAMGLAAFTVTDLVHKRPPSTIVGPWPLARRQFWDVLLILVALYAVLMILPPWGLWRETAPGLPPGRWVALLPVTLLALFIQTGSEELLFRGYLQSQLGARFRSPLAWMVVPSALFGLGHYAPEIYGANAWLVVVWAVIYGMASADLTARAGTLGPAVAFHLANNFVAIGLFSMQGDMSGLALRLLPFGPGDISEVAGFLPIDLAMIGVSWLAARIAIRA